MVCFHCLTAVPNDYWTIKEVNWVIKVVFPFQSFLVITVFLCYLLLYVVICCYMLLYVVICCYMLLYVVKFVCSKSRRFSIVNKNLLICKTTFKMPDEYPWIIQDELQRISRTAPRGGPSPPPLLKIFRQKLFPIWLNHVLKLIKRMYTPFSGYLKCNYDF